MSMGNFFLWPNSDVDQDPVQGVDGSLYPVSCLCTARAPEEEKQGVKNKEVALDSVPAHVPSGLDTPPLL